MTVLAGSQLRPHPGIATKLMSLGGVVGAGDLVGPGQGLWRQQGEVDRAEPRLAAVEQGVGLDRLHSDKRLICASPKRVIVEPRSLDLRTDAPLAVLADDSVSLTPCEEDSPGACVSREAVDVEVDRTHQRPRPRASRHRSGLWP